MAEVAKSLEGVLKVVERCKESGEAVPHILFAAPPGLGKTYTAKKIAELTNRPFDHILAGYLKNPDDFFGLLCCQPKNGILFIDEIHSLTLKVAEVLYPIMEEKTVKYYFKTDCFLLDFSHLTIIGATTELGKVPAPLIRRFFFVIHIPFFTPAELEQILSKEYDLPQDVIKAISERSKGTPRQAKHLVELWHKLNPTSIEEFFKTIRIYDHGLGDKDIRYLKYVKEVPNCGLSSIATALQENMQTVESYIEPYLIEIGFVKRTQNGRVITEKGIEFLRRLN